MFLLDDDEQDALVHKHCFARVLAECKEGLPCTAVPEHAPVPKESVQLPPELEAGAKAAAMAACGQDCPKSTVDAFIVYLQSDRCSGQFLGAPNFSFIAAFHVFLEELTGAKGGVMQQDTDGSKHGKGVSDGDGLDFKQDAGRAELEGVRMEKTQDLYNCMVPRRALGCSNGAPVDNVMPPPVANDGSLPPHTVTRRKLHYVPAGTVQQRFKPVWKTASGSSKCHSARGCGDSAKVLLRRFSCPCMPCMQAKCTADFKKCETRELIGFYKNAKYNNDWVPNSIVQKSGAGIGRAKAQAKIDAAAYVNAKAIGDFVAVSVEDGGDAEGHFWWLARTTSKGYEAPNDHKSTDGVSYKEGDDVIDVQWYFLPNAAADGLLFAPEHIATATLHAESIMRIDVDVVQGANERVTVPRECYDRLAEWHNETDY